MKTTRTRILTAALAVTLALLSLLSFAACGQKQPSGVAAPTPLPHDAKDKFATVAAYITENQALLEEIVTYITAREGLSYFYFVRATDDTVYTEELVNKRGSLVRERVKDKTLEKLAASGFVGELTYSKEATKGIVSFYTYMSNTDASRLFAYCPDETALNFLYDGFFQGANNVSTTPVVGRWYYVEAE